MCVYFAADVIRAGSLATKALSCNVPYIHCMWRVALFVPSVGYVN